MTKILQLKCRFCSKVTGEYIYPSELSESDLKIADIRCSTCETLYGSYNKMVQEYELYGKTYDEFKAVMVKSDYKKVNFDKEVDKIKPVSVLVESILGNKKVKIKKLK